MRHIILALLLVGCADQPAHDYPCRMDCGGGMPKPPPPPRDCVPIYVDGILRACVDRSEVYRVLREAGLAR